MADLIDGRKISKEIREEIKTEVQSLKEQGVVPHLTVVLVGDNPASQVYVRMKGKACAKVGISSETLTYPADMTEQSLLNVIDELNENPKVHGILVQLPLPEQIKEQTVINRIASEKDVDGLNPINAGKLATGMTDGFIPCTPAGVVELLIRSNNNPEGKHAVVVGRSNLVGKPAGMLLLRKAFGGNATVTFCHSRTPDLGEVTRKADILIAAIGYPHLITKDMVKPGVVVIDVGTNRVDDPNQERGYRLVGDVDFEEVSRVAAAITPVPGGVGPMTITMLLKNTVFASRMLSTKE
ncbi:bifunctional 5,10-methylene-tetrahydrofolate dehydrogenase/5,10-methylene-tetrahydrofolate cyclohydrolase [bacterium I07]|nr:bifunctional 5,10-methylene-tetrahydrofolate dehydrogenase/5,10-methylene-tetrahydrofolate cyclohydrolase [bacterium I07]